MIKGFFDLSSLSVVLAFIEMQWRVETCNSLILDVLDLTYHLDIQERCQVNTQMG